MCRVVAIGILEFSAQGCVELGGDWLKVLVWLPSRMVCRHRQQVLGQVWGGLVPGGEVVLKV